MSYPQDLPVRLDGNGTNGINKDVTKNAFNPQLTVFKEKLLATWYEYNSTAYQIRVVVGQ